MTNQSYLRVIICVFITLCIATTTAAPAFAAPAVQTSDPYVFRGQVINADDPAVPMPSIEIQVTCTDVPIKITQSYQNVLIDRQVWEFDEDIFFGAGALSVPTTCDIELQLPAGYQAVDVQGSENMTVVSAAHIRYEDVLLGTCEGNVFQVSKPIAAF